MTVDDNEMQKLWKLTNELTAQLVFNRNATLELKQQLADLQEKTRQAPLVASSFRAQHYSGGNDPPDYKLRIANERLREENSQLQEQVREYERWMEYIMTKFRLQNFAMAQTRRESMHEAYKMTEQGNEVAMRLQEENTLLQARLSELGNVARKAIHEEQYFTTETLIESLESENRTLREMLGVAEGGVGPIAGRIHFREDEDDEDEDGMRRAGNRVSFPSTGTGSNVASSGSDHEQQRRPQRGRPEQPRSPRQHRSQGTRSGLKSPVSPLTVHTGVLRSPKSTSSSASTETSSSSPRSAGSSTSPSSWSVSTSASSSTVVSPKMRPQDSDHQIKSISPVLEGGESTITSGSPKADGEGKQPDRRSKIAVSTILVSPTESKEA
ncbi:hypothetical protein BGZ72_003507 [Mortierella alpina]|nr:hypothetical protein BGZ72_003507 [Mortierella alpina]